MMHDHRKAAQYLLVILIALSGMNAVSADVSVTLESPSQGAVFNDTNLTLFSCNMSTEYEPSFMELYAGTGTMEWLGDSYLKGMPPLDGSVLLMHFNDDRFMGESLSTVYDWSGNGNNGSVSGVGFGRASGRFYGSYLFNGTDNKISVPDSPELDLLDEGTIEFWIRIGNVGGIRDRVLMKGNSWGNGFPYAIYLGSGAKIYLWLENSDTELYTNANLDYDQWYHIVAAWNGSETRMYVNGSLDNTGSGPINMFSNGYALEIGGKTTDWGSEMPFNGSIDELAIYNRMLTPEEVVSHFSSNYSNLTGAQWSINLTDGNYAWNCLAYDNETSNWSASNGVFYVDIMKMPDINWITTWPNDTNDVDPGTPLNVTANITDPSGVSSAVLEYKECLGCTWINAAMQNTSLDEWITNFTTSSNERVYYYRVWSNDTNGNGGYSGTYDISSTLDYTWTMNRSGLEGIKYGYIDTTGSLGDLEVTNTGDDALIFTIGDDWYLDVYYNGSQSGQFTLENNSVASVNITAQFEDHDGESNLTLEISASPSVPGRTASPQNQSMEVTLNTYTGGPYFSMNLLDVPTTVYQGGSFDLTARIKNIGNESATGTVLNFTLPGGCTNSSGNSTVSIGNMSSGETLSFNVTVYVSPSGAAAGASLFGVTVNCTEGVNASETEVIGVACSNSDGICGLGCSYSTDSDCPTSSGGTSGTGTTISGGGISQTEYALSLSAPERAGVVRGDGANITVYVDYGESFTMDGLSLSASGYPQSYISISPEEVNMVNRGDRPAFTVSIRAPPYISTGVYGLVIEASGHGSVVRTNLSGSASVTVSVYSAGNESDVFEKARQAAMEMYAAGFPSEDIGKMLDSMESMISSWDYDSAVSIAGNVISTRDTAFRINQTLGSLEAGIAEARSFGLPMQETERLLDLAVSAFQRGDYERADERTGNAMLSLSIESMGILGALSLMREFWWRFLILIGGGGLILLYANRKIGSRRISGMLRGMEARERAIEGLMLRMQKDYFSGTRGIGPESYQKNMQEYGIQLAEARSGIMRLRGMNRAGGRQKKLERERKDIVGLMKETQEKYFSGSGMERYLYESVMKRMRRDLAGVEKKMDMAGKTGRKGKGSAGFGMAVAAVIVLSLACVGIVTGQAFMDQAGQAISDMSGAGFGTSYANDTLNEARAMLDRGEVAAAEALARQVLDIRDSAFEANELIDRAEESLLDAGNINVSDARELFDEGVGLFMSENYLESREKLESCISMVEDAVSNKALETSAESSPGAALSAWLVNNWYVSLSMLVVAIVVSYFMKARISSSRNGRRLKELAVERESLRKTLVNLQDRYFNSKSISRAYYEESLEEYRKGLVVLEREIYASRDGPAG